VADDVVRLIKDKTDENSVVRRICNFQPNDVIRVTSGPLKDLLGIFERWVSDGERVRVLLNLIDTTRRRITPLNARKGCMKKCCRRAVPRW